MHLIVVLLFLSCLKTANPRSIPTTAETVPETTSAIEDCETIRKKVTNEADKQSVETRVRCTCKIGKVAGTSRENPACVPEYVFQAGLWCDMEPCLPNEECHVLESEVGWICHGEQLSKVTIVKNYSNVEKPPQLPK
ncbi:chemokine-like protein TAFA-1 [Ciona intestinalis]